ncbi:MAG TPA: hypothetical protein VN132_11340, partial [Bdellovibrio sp.]|nr:hypothetical protein [Bdellovibrio sp.]
MVAPQTLHSATQTTYNLGKSVIQKSKATAVAVTGSSRWQASPLRMGSWLKYFKLKIWGKSESAFQKRVRERIQNPLHQPPSDIHPIWLDTNGVGHLRVEKSAGRTFVPDAAESINKDVAERLLITNTIQGQAKALPSARVVRFVRSLLNLNRKLEPWLFWVGLADKKYTNRLEAWTTNVENQAATKIQRLFRQKRLRPDLNPEQQAKIQQSIRNRLDQIEKYKKSVSLSYEDKVIDGLQARGSIIKSKWARSLEKDMPLWAVVVNRSQDRMLQHHLAHFEHHLQGHPSLQKLRQALVHPEQMTDQSDEVMALKQLMGWVNQPFVSKLSFATANVLYDDLARRVGATNPFVKEFGSIYQIGKLKRSFKPLLFGDYTLPLGHVLESGAGV